MMRLTNEPPRISSGVQPSGTGPESAARASQQGGRSPPSQELGLEAFMDGSGSIGASVFEDLADEELLALSARRAEAFGAFYERHAEPLLRFFARRTVDPE